MVYRLFNENLEVQVAPDDGMNLLSVRFHEEESVFLDEKKRAERLRTYGIPILFPTPNRTRDNVYTFDGVRYPAVMHGFVKHAVFDVVENSDEHISAQIVFDGSEPLFPFKARMTATVSLEKDTVRHTVKLENLDSVVFGYGLALHPFFVKKPGSTLRCNVKKQMLTTEELLPTGKCIDVEETEFDFNKSRCVDELALDTVFICSGSLECEYRTPSYDLDIRTSEDYDHVVLYTTREAPFICFEPQTCSTDFFNMATEGYEREAHLLTLAPGEEREHFVDFSYSVGN